MSDQGRKDFKTGVKEGIIPDSTKSTQQKMKETATGATDRFVRDTQTDQSKSTGQKVHDKTQRASDNEKHGGTLHSIGDKVKNTMGLNK